MTATFAPSPWPAPVVAPRPVPAWRFGREETVSGPSGPRRVLHWVMKRNCSLTPRQLSGVYLSLCAVSLVISLGFWLQGAPFVGAFAGLELLCMGAALLVYARHAGDREVLTLAGPSLAVEQWLGGRVQRADFQADWLAVEPVAGPGSLIEISARGRCLRVGRFLRPELRAAFAQELRRAVRRPEPESASETE